MSTASGTVNITNFHVSNSRFIYGKAIEIDQASNLVMASGVYRNNSLQDQDFLSFDQIGSA